MRTLLLADDNITVQRVIALTFAQEPVRIVTASDGHQAMDRVVVDRPDIVLAGTTLPEVNGYDLARFVKSKPESKHVPVLLLSGAFESIDEAELLASGANGVIEKPVEPTVVIRRVNELLGLKTRDAAPAAGRLVTPETVTAGHRPTPTMPRAVTTSRPMPPPAAWDERRDQTPDKNARPAEDSPEAMITWSPSATRSTRSINSSRAASPPTTAQSLTAARSAPSVRRSAIARPDACAAVGRDARQPVYEVDEDWFGDSPSRDRRAPAAVT